MDFIFFLFLYKIMESNTLPPRNHRTGANFLFCQLFDQTFHFSKTSLRVHDWATRHVIQYLPKAGPIRDEDDRANRGILQACTAHIHLVVLLLPLDWSLDGSSSPPPPSRVIHAWSSSPGSRTWCFQDLRPAILVGDLSNKSLPAGISVSPSLLFPA